MIAAFSDEALVAGALAFETALARAQAACGLIPPAHADLIADAAAALPDLAALAEAAAHSGTLAIPLVEELRRRVAERNPQAATAVHLGATSQDVADTALMLQARRGLEMLRPDLARLSAALAVLAAEHAATPMLGRTLAQPAAAITFGLKAAQWRLGLAEAVRRLEREAQEALCLQLGGAVGTLDGMEGRGPEVAARLAQALGLADAPAPWHSRRGAVAGLGAALAIVAGAVGKLARDVALMAQAEVGEAREPQVAGRGGSSAMPHKRNPTGCQVALSAALRAPPLAATLMAALPQEHERGLGGWQAEGPVLADLFLVTHGAVRAMADVAEGLEVDTGAMQRNLEAAGVGGDPRAAEALARRLLEGGDG